MAEENKSCGCSCICDPTVARVLDQQSMRFNERAGFAHANAMDNQTLLLSAFQATAQNTLDSEPVSKITSDLASMFAAFSHKGTGGV
jgi:vacuolar-type H+-ATPase catalytic subunit A/Vma1